jgi:hypothetical protein
LSNGERLGISIGAHIGVGQFVLALPASFEVGGQFISAKDRTVLNTDVMIAEDGQVCSDRDLLREPSVRANVEPIDTRILSLVKTEIPKLHEFSLFGRGAALVGAYQRGSRR